MPASRQDPRGLVASCIHHLASALLGCIQTVVDLATATAALLRLGAPQARALLLRQLADVWIGYQDAFEFRAKFPLDDGSQLLPARAAAAFGGIAAPGEASSARASPAAAAEAAAAGPAASAAAGAQALLMQPNARPGNGLWEYLHDKYFTAARQNRWVKRVDVRSRPPVVQ